MEHFVNYITSTSADPVNYINESSSASPDSLQPGEVYIYYEPDRKGDYERDK